MDLLLTNNPQFLFHKYAKLVTWFANTQLGRDYLGIKEKNIVELLPNSHRAFLDRSAEKFYLKSTFYPCDFYNKKLGAALSALDIVSDWIKSFKDGQEALAFYLGLRTPTILLPKIYMATLTADALSTGGNELGNVSTVSYATAHDAASGSEVNVVNQIFDLTDKENQDKLKDNYVALLEKWSDFLLDLARDIGLENKQVGLPIVQSVENNLRIIYGLKNKFSLDGDFGCRG